MPTKEPQEPVKLYTPRQAAEFCGIHYNTMLAYIKAGHIEVLRLPSGYYRIESTELEKFLQSWHIKKTKQIKPSKKSKPAIA